LHARDSRSFIVREHEAFVPIQACAPWIVLIDEPDDFVDLPVRAIYHKPTGPIAIDR
jgi:hypothetical protein